MSVVFLTESIVWNSRHSRVQISILSRENFYSQKNYWHILYRYGRRNPQGLKDKGWKVLNREYMTDEVAWYNYLFGKFSEKFFCILDKKKPFVNDVFNIQVNCVEFRGIQEYGHLKVGTSNHWNFLLYLVQVFFNRSREFVLNLHHHFPILLNLLRVLHNSIVIPLNLETS